MTADEPERRPPPAEWVRAFRVPSSTVATAPVATGPWRCPWPAASGGSCERHVTVPRRAAVTTTDHR
jgi:hypothetical protein